MQQVNGRRVSFIKECLHDKMLPYLSDKTHTGATFKSINCWVPLVALSFNEYRMGTVFLQAAQMSPVYT